MSSARADLSGYFRRKKRREPRYLAIVAVKEIDTWPCRTLRADARNLSAVAGLAPIIFYATQQAAELVPLCVRLLRAGCAPIIDAFNVETGHCMRMRAIDTDDGQVELQAVAAPEQRTWLYALVSRLSLR